ncbi:hypothetical protein IEO21_06268 [Rhodonia placenta]|uniref:Cytochrome P450 n=1 Tax=Rhodonia placenta TaxID=104341 RepID=A0A8H7U1H1_9APHY|nr:hypothetical protein IEO21_06268 [Postia placenta]
MSVIAWAVGAALVAFSCWKLLKISGLLQPYMSPLGDIPGPPSPSFLYGNMHEIQNSEASIVREQWVDMYGPTLKYKGWLNVDRLYTLDTRAIHHVLTHSNDYPKMELSRYFLTQVTGHGDLHRKQLRALWTATLELTGGPARIDVLSGLTKVTLDVIGLAGFNIDFGSLNPNGHARHGELTDAFNVMFGALGDTRTSLFRAMKAYLPPLRLIPDSTSARVTAARKVIDRVGMQLIREKKAEVIKAERTGEKNTLHSRDLLTLLIRANMSTDIPENQRLSDAEVLAQIPTFLAAGHETTSNSTAWCLYALAQHPAVQSALRDELLSVPTDSPSMDDLNALPYLDAVVRETMRLHAPVSSTMRYAAKDDVIPLAAPYTDRNGEVCDGIRVSKGSPIIIPILAMNRSKAVWGEDAHEFRPERWESTIETAQHMPGVWAHMMSFLGGPRACIGYRFSLVEMKALMFVLVRGFEFELAVPICKKRMLVQRPFVSDEMDKGAQLPLLVKPYVHA